MAGGPELSAAIADVAEGFCPLCRVPLITHDGRACCPCGGCSYRLEGERFEMTTCELHPGVRCEHWEADACHATVNAADAVTVALFSNGVVGGRCARRCLVRRR
jgi:hypothetical protein